MNRRYLATVLLTLTTMCFLMGMNAYGADESVAAGSSPPEVTGLVGVTGLNKYIFRGYEIGGDSLVLQPYISVSYAGFSVTTWDNFDSKEHNTQSFYPNSPGSSSLDETDVITSYKKSFDKLSLSFGYNYYGLRYAKKSQEVLVSIAYEGFVTPTLTVYREVAAFPNVYVNLALKKSIPVYKDITLDAGASFGHLTGLTDHWDTYQASTKAYTGIKYSAFHDGKMELGFTVPVAQKLILQPLAQFWFPLSDKAREFIDGHSYNLHGKLDNNFVYGLNLMYIL
jgi:hypothetical protein